MAKEPDTAESMAARAQFRESIEDSMRKQGLDPDELKDLVNTTVRVTDEVIDELLEQARKDQDS
jgi:hypothetical protein